MWTFHVIEMSVFLFFAVAVWHSTRAGLAKISTLLGGVVFGWLIELYFVTFAQGYAYGDFLVDPAIGGHSVPLWVGVGWGTIIYCAMVASDRMGLPVLVRPAADALLAVSIDVALDPIAEHMGWWSWSRDSQFFGIPCDNFIGWIMIVGFYSMIVRQILRLLESHPQAWSLLAPLGAILSSCLLVVVCQFGLEALYPIAGEPLVFAILALALFLTVAAWWGKDPSSSQPADRFPTIVAATMHVLLLTMLVTTETYLQIPELLVILPMAAMASVLGFHHRSVPSSSAS